MSNWDFGYMDNPANGLGIIRSRTLLGNFRLWDIPRSEEALDIVINEIGHSPIPGGDYIYCSMKETEKFILDNLKI